MTVEACENEAWALGYVIVMFPEQAYPSPATTEVILRTGTRAECLASAERKPPTVETPAWVAHRLVTPVTCGFEAHHRVLAETYRAELEHRGEVI